MKDRTGFMTRTATVCLGAMVCCALWGSAFPGIKIGYELLGITAEQTGVQILYAGCRFFLAGILAILIGSFLQRRFLYPKRNEIPKVLWLSCFQTVLQYICFYIGLAHTSGIKASIINGTNVFIAIFVAGVLFHQESINVQKIIGTLIGFSGVVLVNLAGNSLGAFTWSGDGLIILSAVAYAFSSVFLKRYSRDHDPVMLSGYQFMAGGAVMILGSLLSGARMPEMSVGAFAMLFYLALVSAVAYSLWGILLKYNPVSRVTVFGFMIPVFGVLFSALILREADSLGSGSILALILVAVGIYIVNRSNQSRT